MARIENFWQGIQEETARLRAINSAVLGCRFLYSPKETLEHNNGLLLAGMNPGKEVDMRDRAYPGDGRNAYQTEDWGISPFRNRMVAFMTRLFEEFGLMDAEAAFNQTLTSNFLPFRTARFAELRDQRKDAMRYGSWLWTEILPLAGVRAIICCGEASYVGFQKACSSSRIDIPVIGITHASVGTWGPWVFDHCVKQLRNADFQFRAGYAGHSGAGIAIRSLLDQGPERQGRCQCRSDSSKSGGTSKSAPPLSRREN